MADNPISIQRLSALGISRSHAFATCFTVFFSYGVSVALMRVKEVDYAQLWFYFVFTRGQSPIPPGLLAPSDTLKIVENANKFNQVLNL